MGAEHAIRTRMGDGSLVEMTRSDIRADVEAMAASQRRDLDDAVARWSADIAFMGGGG